MRQVTNLASAAESSAELVTRACRGDTGAFEDLYRQHVGRVYGLCLRMTGAAGVRGGPDPGHLRECLEEPARL